MKNEPKVSGDLFWALQAHNDKSSAGSPFRLTSPTSNTLSAVRVASGGRSINGGINTITMTKDDMAARAELLRTHAFEIAGVAVPPHAVPLAPVITVNGLGLIASSAARRRGQVHRRAQRKTTPPPGKSSATNAPPTRTPRGSIPNRHPASSTPSIALRIAYNADGKASEPSAGADSSKTRTDTNAVAHPGASDTVSGSHATCLCRRVGLGLHLYLTKRSTLAQYALPGKQSWSGECERICAGSRRALAGKVRGSRTKWVLTPTCNPASMSPQTFNPIRGS